MQEESSIITVYGRSESLLNSVRTIILDASRLVGEDAVLFVTSAAFYDYDMAYTGVSVARRASL